MVVVVDFFMIESIIICVHKNEEQTGNRVMAVPAHFQLTSNTSPDKVDLPSLVTSAAVISSSVGR